MAPQPPLSRSKSFREQMEEEGVDLDELYNVDSVVEEEAELMKFDATQNTWESSKTTIKVARRMFAHGDKYGCIRMRDVSDGRVKVLKKCLRGGGEDELYDEIKAHALGELCCRLFRQAVKMAKVAFAPRVIYKLTQRENRPKILCEELLTDGDDFVKQRLSLFAPRDATPEQDMACHAWAIFQFFTYVQSQRGMVFESCDAVHHIWMNPVIHSNDESLGGKCDGGPKAIEAWEREFAAKYAELFSMPSMELMEMDPKQMLDLFEGHDLLPWTSKPTESPREQPQASDADEPEIPSSKVCSRDLVQQLPASPQHLVSNDAGEATLLPSSVPHAASPRSLGSRSSRSRSRSRSRRSPAPGSQGSAADPEARDPLQKMAREAPTAVCIVIKLGLDGAAAGVERSPQRAAFQNNLTQDLAEAAGVSAQRFEIQGLVSSASGSTITVDMRIHPDPSGRTPGPFDVAQDLQRQTGDAGSALNRGVLTRHTEDITRAPQPQAAAAPTVAQALSPPSVAAVPPRSDEAQLAALKAKLQRYQREYGDISLNSSPPAPPAPDVFEGPPESTHSKFRGAVNKVVQGTRVAEAFNEGKHGEAWATRMMAEAEEEESLVSDTTEPDLQPQMSAGKLRGAVNKVVQGTRAAEAFNEGKHGEAWATRMMAEAEEEGENISEEREAGEAFYNAGQRALSPPQVLRSAPPPAETQGSITVQGVPSPQLQPPPQQHSRAHSPPHLSSGNYGAPKPPHASMPANAAVNPVKAEPRGRHTAQRTYLDTNPGMQDWEKELRMAAPAPSVNWGAYRSQVLSTEYR